MKAIRLYDYGGPETLVLENVSKPEPKHDQVLVKIHAASVNHIDWGKASGMLKHIFPLQFPWVPGEDFAGIVESVGENVKSFKPGDAVFGHSSGGGAYAEFVAVGTETIAKMPSNLTFVEAAAVPVAAETAWQGLFIHARLAEGQTILIHGGAGAVGAYAIQFAHQAGATVIVTASGSDTQFLESLGADRIIDYKTEKFESGTNNADVVFDLVGGEIQQRSYGVLKEGGQLIATNHPVSVEEAAKHRISAMLMHMKPSREGLNHIAELLEAGKIRPDIADILPLEKAPEAWKSLSLNLSVRSPTPNKDAHKKNGHGKIVLQVVVE